MNILIAVSLFLLLQAIPAYAARFPDVSVYSTGGGQSFVNDNNYNVQIKLNRGISLLTFIEGYGPHLIKTFDPCSYITGESIKSLIDRYPSNDYLIVSSDTPHCGGNEFKNLSDGLKLYKFNTLAYRDSYIAIYKSNSTIAEFKSPSSLQKVFNVNYAAKKKPIHKIGRVAHAGGGLGSSTYTNSLDALNKNKKSFDYFEIDFEFTSDNKLVCLHDWSDNFKANFNVNYTGPVSYKEFENLIVSNVAQKNCTIYSLGTWLTENPNKYIITDFKGDHIEGLKIISSTLPNLIDRFIPQIYQPEDHKLVSSLGFKNIIWTLYKYQGSDRDVVENAFYMNLFAVTMDKSRFDSFLHKRLIDITGNPVYLFTVNHIYDYDKYIASPYSEIYTDFLLP